jgi:hypothetical protein
LAEKVQSSSFIHSTCIEDRRVAEKKIAKIFIIYIESAYEATSKIQNNNS